MTCGLCSHSNVQPLISEEGWSSIAVTLNASNMISDFHGPWLSSLTAYFFCLIQATESAEAIAESLSSGGSSIHHAGERWHCCDGWMAPSYLLSTEGCRTAEADPSINKAQHATHQNLSPALLDLFILAGFRIDFDADYYNSYLANSTQMGHHELMTYLLQHAETQYLYSLLILFSYHVQHSTAHCIQVF